MELTVVGSTGPARPAIKGASSRQRAVLTRVLLAMLGFILMAFASAAGAEAQYPLAAVAIGGLAAATLLTLVVMPSLAARLRR